MPYPTIAADGTLLPGFIYDTPPECGACRDKACRLYAMPPAGESVKTYTCPVGFSVISMKAADLELRINGVVEAASNSASSRFKKEHKQLKVKMPQLITLATRLKTAKFLSDSAVRSVAQSELATLHDIRSVIATIQKNIDNLIFSQPGDTPAEKVNAVSGELRDIFQAARLLELLLQYTDIVANPAAACFGSPIATPLHRLASAIVPLFEARANKRDVAIQLTGRSFNAPLMYKSFPILLVTLIDNAVKYADPHSSIVVQLWDGIAGSGRIEVTSVGQLVPKSEAEAIFEKNYRGQNARNIPGSGIGLYIARAIAHANGVKLAYAATPHGDSRMHGANSFVLEVPPVAPPTSA